MEEEAHSLESSFMTVLEEAHRSLETGGCPRKDAGRAEEPCQEAPLRQPSRLAEDDALDALKGRVAALDMTAGPPPHLRVPV
jgi:hypothetical protein